MSIEKTDSSDQLSQAPEAVRKEPTEVVFESHRYSVGKKQKQPEEKSLIETIETLSSQLSEESSEGAIEELLRSIRKTARLIKQSYSTSGNMLVDKEISSLTDSVQRILSIIKKPQLNTSVQRTVRMIHSLTEIPEETPPEQATSRKRAFQATESGKKTLDELYNLLRDVVTLSSGIKEKSESKQEQLLETIQTKLAEFERPEAFTRRQKVDPEQVRQFLFLKLKIQQEIATLPREKGEIVLSSLNHLQKMFSSEVMPTIHSILDSIQSSKNPLEALAKDLPLIQVLHGTDIYSRAFLRDFEKLVVLFRSRSSEEVRLFLLPLLRRTLISGPELLSPFESHKIAANALFILDKSPDLFSSAVSDDFSSLIQQLKSSAIALSSKIDSEAKQTLEDLFSGYGLPESIRTIHLHQVPLRVAKLLVLSDGSLNLGLVTLIKDTLLSSRSHEQKREGGETGTHCQCFTSPGKRRRSHLPPGIYTPTPGRKCWK
jgi:hypothetical protein